MRLIDAAFTVYAAESEFDEEDASKIRWLISHIPSVDAVHVVHCEACTHMRKENGVLRCPYSTVDLDPNGYCHRGVKKGQEEACVATDEALWLIVKEAGFHDGVLYTTPMIACSECGVVALHEQSEGMGHGGPQTSCRWIATHHCPNCGKEMKNWRIKYETESSGGGMPE